METTVSVSDSSISKRTRRKVSVKSYSENLIDELMDGQLGGFKKKRIRTKEQLEKETEVEAMIALSLGFPIDDLLEEEIKAGVVIELGGKEQNDYIVVRNHILSRWRSNVRSWVSKGQIRETIPEEATEGSVIIVGAGLAGLAAARQLMSFGFKVVVLEGRNRPGGRVYTQYLEQNGNNATVDLGGSVITGIDANPLGVLARQLSIPLHKVRDKCPLYQPDGAPVDVDIDSKVELIFNKLLDKVMELRRIMGGFANDISLGSVLETLTQLYAVARTTKERQLLDWHFANLEYANAGCLSNLSAAHWDQDDPFEMGGDHCLLVGGNYRLIKALCKGIPVFYGKTVHTIRYGNGAEVIAGGQVFQADMILCTVPLGVLKRKSITFEPELPEKKVAAIERLGFGLLNKVAMVFPYVFWEEDLDTFGRLNQHRHKRGEFFLFYSYHTVSGGPVLVALVAGGAAQLFEYTEPSILVHHIIDILRGIYGPKGINVPDPVQSMCTRWGSDPFTFGSYSHVRVGSSGSDYDTLAESVGGRLFFAGEATIRQHPATMHGAYLSGIREASHIFQAMKQQQNNPRKCVTKNSAPCTEILTELFKRPDLAFGQYSFVFDPLNDDPTSWGLMQVTLTNAFMELSDDFSCRSETESMHKQLLEQPLRLYTVLTQSQALKIQLMTRRDDCKILHLFKNLGLKLLGADSLGDLGNSIATNIANARRGKSRHRMSGIQKNAGGSNLELPSL
ncbi:unnamed protein product [Cuscuta campestris]|uniref:Amine oxidase domain-containing protein n=1 Tax=Cuscuta campestris TaxID=132261 RepID=A0A484LTK4_9ASTE|nr:unnamed protein product [Cuscuta campestris]